VIGINIGKDAFHLVSFDTDSKIVLRKRIKHLPLVPTFEKPSTCIVGMEAYLGTHFVSRTLASLALTADYSSDVFGSVPERREERLQ